MHWVVPKGTDIEPISRLWSPQPPRPTANTWARGRGADWPGNVNTCRTWALNYR